jgi:hypothetical protein
MKARDNPFKTDRVLGVRYRLRDRTWEELLGRLKRLNYRAAIVGPNGAGKTTLLEDLEPRLAGLGFTVRCLRLDRETRSFPRGFLKDLFAALDERDLLLFDGAEQMSRFAWASFKTRSKRAGGLVITSHRRGMLPTLIECATSSELLDEIIAELLGATPQAPRETTEKLYAKHNGNLRDALREMYDMYAAKDFKIFIHEETQRKH